jgi:putative SOS response-associated peptidase YedK
MCGRYSLTADLDHLVAHFQATARLAGLLPRYNIAPSQSVVIVRNQPETQERELSSVHWGLIPSWAKDPKIGNRLINARAETLSEKPSFRAAFRRRRCLLPATGFYEWHQHDEVKQPYNFCRRDGEVFALAGLWEHWQRADGSVLESCLVITVPADYRMESYQQRMPAIVEPTDYDTWLSVESPAPHLHDVLLRASMAGMEIYPVSTRVNAPIHDEPDCLDPLAS